MAKKNDTSENNKKTILYVDDNEMIINLTKMGLNHFGYNVEVTTNGEKALSLVESFPEKFNLIITDLKMHPMNGITLCKLVKKIAPHIPIIISSGSHIDANDLKDACADGSIRKPYSFEKIDNMITKVIGP